MAALHLLLAAMCLPVWAADINPPTMDDSYKAMGELVQDVEGMGTFQVRFEEHYDKATGNAEFTVWQIGKKETFLEIKKANQTVLYENEACKVVTKKEFIQVQAPPSFLGYSDTSGRIRFSLRHLLDIDPKHLVKGKMGVPATFRDIPAVSWMYEMKGVGGNANTIISVYAYWSDPSWSTVSGKQQVPLGFELTNITTVSRRREISVQFVSVFAFLKGVVDANAFKPREGIFCEGRTHPYNLPRFPLVKSISLRSEFLSPKSQDIRSMDAYYDTDNGFLRVDTTEVDSFVADAQPVPRYISQITSKSLGVTFRSVVDHEGWSCRVVPIDKYQFESEEIINPKLDVKLWSIHAIIGRNTTDYVFIGNTHKRNIPCKLYQGIRKDWPEPGAKITSLWEWCFAFMIESEDESVYFRDDEVGLIYASIKIIEDQSNLYPTDYRMVHNFYDVMQEDPANMSFTTFDPYRCFKQDEKRFLEFTVNANISDDNINLYENATSDLHFLTAWKIAIAAGARVSRVTLRVNVVQSFVFNKKLYVNCILLGLHKDLPDAAKKGEPSLDMAISNLEVAINSGKLKIDYKPAAQKSLTLAAVKNSLVKSFKNTDFTPLTTTTTKGPVTTRPTLPTISLIVDETTPTKGVSGDDSSQSTASRSTATVTTGETVTYTGTGPTPSSGPIDAKEEVVFEGHQPGSVAGISIAMILIGLTFGAGGTFYSYKGLPSFLRFK